MLDTNPQRGTIYLEDLKTGMSIQKRTRITQQAIDDFAKVSGDHNPIHLNAEYAAGSLFKTTIAHGSHTASLFSAAIGEHMPGHGTIYLAQTLRFCAPVRADDDVVVTVTIKSIDHAKAHVVIECVATVDAAEVLTGEAVVLAPSRGA